MAVVIAELNSDEFSYNGVPYKKSFSPAKYVDNVRVFAANDVRFELIPFTVYSDYTVDGQTYGNVDDLINALATVIYKTSTASVSNKNIITINSQQVELEKNPSNTVNLTTVEAGDRIKGFYDGKYGEWIYVSGDITLLTSYRKIYSITI